jgi:hypothetical protein
MIQNKIELSSSNRQSNNGIGISYIARKLEGQTIQIIQRPYGFN